MRRQGTPGNVHSHSQQPSSSVPANPQVIVTTYGQGVMVHPNAFFTHQPAPNPNQHPHAPNQHPHPQGHNVQVQVQTNHHGHQDALPRSYQP